VRSTTPRTLQPITGEERTGDVAPVVGAHARVTFAR
jgi:hypothetical protein